MRRSFYQYVMSLRGPAHDEPTTFANNVAKDRQFPKQATNYEELSSYLEFHTNYLHNLDIFDELWEKYLENNQ